MAMLLVSTGSCVSLDTLAVLVRIVFCGTFAFTMATTTIEIVESRFNTSIDQTGALQVPLVGVALTNVRPAGSVSATLTFRALEGP